MNDTAWQTGAPIIDGGPVWLTASFVLIGLGVLFALFILAWGTRLARRRQQARDQLEERGELHDAGDPKTPAAQPIATPPAPAPPPIADAPVIAAPPPPAPEPAPEPAPLADEPIAAAAPLDASPASLAASEPEAPAGADDFTRMKGVGPKLADRLNALGVTSFAQIAALTPEQAAALDAELGTFQGRIHRDRWIEQAGFLARGDTAGYEAVFGKL
nr:helix-hairpin-helix domain-containing protein [uncultured Sphingomonas sp.]